MKEIRRPKDFIPAMLYVNAIPKVLIDKCTYEILKEFRQYIELLADENDKDHDTYLYQTLIKDLQV